MKCIVELSIKGVKDYNIIIQTLVKKKIINILILFIQRKSI